MQQQRPEPLTSHPKYQKVRELGAPAAAGSRRRCPEGCTRASRGAGCFLQPRAAAGALLTASRACVCVQIKDLNSGTFGFVQLALDKTTGRNVAIKFIERGDKVSGSRHAVCPGLVSCLQLAGRPSLAPLQPVVLVEARRAAKGRPRQAARRPGWPTAPPASRQPPASAACLLSHR